MDFYFQNEHLREQMSDYFFFNISSKHNIWSNIYKYSKLLFITKLERVQFKISYCGRNKEQSF